MSSAAALDRNAFTFVRYDLEVRMEREQQRLEVRGKLLLRNDSTAPQKSLALQISSTLDWHSIRAGGKPLQFVSHRYASDVDHTGVLSEAVVALTREIKPRETIELEIGYEGTVPLDATRLTRIGTPEEIARRSDWDRISIGFTGVRGVGHVAWYPVAVEVGNLSEGNSLFEVLAGWKARAAEGTMRLRLADESSGPPELLHLGEPVALNADAATETCPPRPGEEARGSFSTKEGGPFQFWCRVFTYAPLGQRVPALLGGYNSASASSGAQGLLMTLPGEWPVPAYAEVLGRVQDGLKPWFGAPKPVMIYQLPEAGDAPYESGASLMLPLLPNPGKSVAAILAHQVVHADFASFRPWVYEGLAYFGQALQAELQNGRQGAMDSLGRYRPIFAASDKEGTADAGRALISTHDEALYGGKAAYVWWMLRDMLGEAAFQQVLHSYHAEDDTDAKYVERLVQQASKRDLGWFFDDWVHHDRGLPEFKVQAVFPRKTDKGLYLVAVTVENLGNAGAEVPLTVTYSGGEITARMEVQGKSSATTRIETPAPPLEVRVNDGSVPVAGTTQVTFKITQ